MGVPREKMAAHLRRAIQAVFDRGLHDPRVKGMVTVTRLDLSPDFANATVHVTVMPEEHAELTMHGVKNASDHVRAQVSRRAEFRRVPALHFRLDTVRRREADVLATIARTTAEDEERAVTRGESPEAAESAAGGDEDVLGAFDAFLAEAGSEAADPAAGQKHETGGAGADDAPIAGDDGTSGSAAEGRRPTEDEAT